MAQITDYGTLTTAVEAFATYDQSASVPYFIDWAHQEICRRLRCNSMVASVEATLSDETIAVPTRFAGIKRFYLGTSPRRYLTVTSAEQAHEVIGQWTTTSYPTYVAVEGAEFVFAPLYTASTTGRLLYYEKPAEMSDDTDTNTVLTAYPMLYLWGALEALYRFMEDDNQADRYGQLFGALIEDINAQEAKDVMNGPLQARGHMTGIV